MKGFTKTVLILGMLLALLGAGFVWKTLRDRPAAMSAVVASDPGLDAYRAARLLVGKSLLSSPTATFSTPASGSGAGYEQQPDGTWKVWGWVDTDNALGGRLHEDWRCVMQHQGEGRKWRALWLKVGDQQSGDASAWKEAK